MIKHGRLKMTTSKELAEALEGVVGFKDIESLRSVYAHLHNSPLLDGETALDRLAALNAARVLLRYRELELRGAEVQVATPELPTFKLSVEGAKEFETLSKAIMLFLSKHCHPHCTIIADSRRCELVEGVHAEVPQ
jgi:hypothetical protein